MPATQRERRDAFIKALKATATHCERHYPSAQEAATFVYNILRHPITHKNVAPKDFTGNVAIAESNPRLVEYPDTKTGRKREGKPHTFLKYINRQFNLNITEAQTDRISTVLGEQLPTKWGYDFVLAGGPEIKEVYRETINTCMTGKRCLNFYARNDPQVRVIKIMKNGVLHGRAILWELIDGNHFVDRIYPSSGPHVDLLLTHIREQGWVWRGSTAIEVGNITPSLTTAPLKPAKDSEHAQHSMGGFPYMDTFRWMKHSPDFTQVMLRYTEGPGFVPLGPTANAYENKTYCHLARGWFNKRDMVTNARVMNEDGTFRAETEFHQPTLRRTHTLISYHEERPLLNATTRVFVPNEMEDELTYDPITQKRFLKQQAVTDTNGRATFIGDAFRMHDGTYLRQMSNLRRVAQLPNGFFVLRDDAEYDHESREWKLKGENSDDAAELAAAS